MERSQSIRARGGIFHLTPDNVHLWNVSLEVSSENYQRCYATLSDDERGRSARFQFEHDRRRFVVSHGILRELLSCYLETQPGSIRFVYNAFGKPDLDPEFCDPLKFNLSHSGDLALIAVAAGSNLGVDIEYIRSYADILDIARRFFTASEVNHLARLSGDRRAMAFFGYWTRTEAYLKARGDGLANHDGASDGFGTNRRWSLHTLRPAPGYVGALAIEGRGKHLTPRHWRMGVG